MHGIRRIYNFGLGERITWLVRAADSPIYPIGDSPGWSLLSPLNRAALGFVEERDEWGFRARVSEDGLLVECRSLTLKYQGSDPPAEEDETPWKVAVDVLRRLRFTSRQFAIPRRLASVRHEESGADDNELVIPQAEGITGWIVRDYWVPTAITEQHATEATRSENFVVPVHADIFLDALEAHIEEDYRKAILYSAIAVECFVAEQLAVEYEGKLARKDPALRIVEIATAGGASVSKDPVYEVLRANERFEKLLREQSLYVLGRSLFVEEQDIYRRALKLHATRNKIVHSGSPPEDEAYFAVSRAGAIGALETAIEVLAWYGDAGPYYVWKGFIRASDGSTVIRLR